MTGWWDGPVDGWTGGCFGDVRGGGIDGGVAVDEVDE